MSFGYEFIFDISQISEQHAMQVLSVPSFVALETGAAFRSEICEMMDKIAGSKQKRIRVICEICGDSKLSIV